MSDTPQDQLPPPIQAPTGPPVGPPAVSAMPPAPGQVAGFAPYGQPQQFAAAATHDDRSMATLIHVLLMFTGFLGPLIIWLTKKDESPFIDRHGKTALNFVLTMAIASFVTVILCFVLIGFLLIPVLAVVGFVFPIMAAVAANKGEDYEYPLTIPFFT